MLNEQLKNRPSGKPWYREPWAWFVLFPLILVVIVSAIMVSIAVRHADDTVSDTYYKDSRMYHFSAHQDVRAQELQLAGFLNFQQQETEVTLDLDGTLAYPPQLLLTLSHPMEADFDQHIVLEQVSAGHYRGNFAAPLSNRWYLRLMPELEPTHHQEASWRLKGEINFAFGNAIALNPASQ